MPHSHSTLTLADLLFQYSEFIDGEHLMLGEKDSGDDRSHDDLVKAFLAERMEQHPEIAHFGEPMTMVMQSECAVHKHDEWVPVNDHHVWPQGLGGPDTKTNKITLCTNGHYAIHEFIRQLILHAGTVPWTTAQHFGPKVRDIARIGWERAGKPTKGGIPE